MRCLFWVWTLVLFFFSSCVKESDPTVLPQEDDLKLVQMDRIHSNFYVSKENLHNIFPGNILSVDTLGASVKFVKESDYAALPIRISSSSQFPNLGSLSIVPSFNALSDYIQPLNTSGGIGNESLSLSDWQLINDPKVILNFQGINGDLEEFIKLLPTFEGKSIVPKSTTCLFKTAERTKTTVDMSLPKIGELISVDEEEALLNSHPCYYINSVGFGVKFYLLAYSTYSSDDMTKVLKKVFDNTSLDRKEEEILEGISLFVFLRTSQSQDAYLNKAKGKNAIASVVKEFHQKMDAGQDFYKYPISFRMRHLKDLSLFKHQYVNKWYVREE